MFVMLMGILAMQPVRAGDVQWNLQLHWQAPVHQHYLGCPHYPHPPCHNCSGGTIGTGPTTSHTDIHNHVHRPYLYGWHIHQGVKYPVEYVYRNYRGEICKEFQMDVQFMFGRGRAWATVCQDRAGFWRLQR